MKKFINNAENVIKESLAGFAAAHSGLVKVRYHPNYIFRSDAPVQGKVALVSGGGSGHEPLHGGFVGKGMLDAACPGYVFTSPTPDQIEAATRAVSNGAGVLHLVKNYPGDVMNFEMAAELCQEAGIHVEAVVIDDEALKESRCTARRRGMGSVIIAEKICGAAAEQGKSLQEVADLCRKVNANGRSLGMALTSCTTPSAGKPTFDLGDDELEIGVGIHGELGRKRMKMKPAKDIVEILMETIVTDLPYTSGDQVIALINGMGGTPLIELHLIYNEVATICKAKGISIARSLVGNYITTLDMQGCSITLVKADDVVLQLWDAPVHTPALRW